MSQQSIHPKTMAREECLKLLYSYNITKQKVSTDDKLAETIFNETIKFFETYNFLYDKEYSAALLGMSSLKLKQGSVSGSESLEKMSSSMTNSARGSLGPSRNLSI